MSWLELKGRIDESVVVVDVYWRDENLGVIYATLAQWDDLLLSLAATDRVTVGAHKPPTKESL